MPVRWMERKKFSARAKSKSLRHITARQVRMVVGLPINMSSNHIQQYTMRRLAVATFCPASQTHTMNLMLLMQGQPNPTGCPRWSLTARIKMFAGSTPQV